MTKTCTCCGASLETVGLEAPTKTTIMLDGTILCHACADDHVSCETCDATTRWEDLGRVYGDAGWCAPCERGDSPPARKRPCVLGCCPDAE